MSFSLIGSTGAFASVGGNAFNTPNLDTTGANLLVGSFAWVIGNAIGTWFTDSKGNTWSFLSELQIAPYGQSFIIGYSVPTSVGSGHNWGQTGTNYASISIAAFSGAKASSPLDQSSSANTFPNSVTSVQPGAIVPTEDNELIITGLGSGDASIAIDSGYTIIQQQAGVSAGSYANTLAYKIQTTAASTNPTWSRTPNEILVTEIMSFKAAVVAATVINNPLVHSQSIRRASNW